MSDDLGSLIKEANPPKNFKKLDAPVILKSKNVEWNKKYKAAMTEDYYADDYMDMATEAKVSYKSQK